MDSRTRRREPGWIFGGFPIRGREPGFDSHHAVGIDIYLKLDAVRRSATAIDFAGHFTVQAAGLLADWTWKWKR